jgi:hypothetical protein
MNRWEPSDRSTQQVLKHEIRLSDILIFISRLTGNMQPFQYKDKSVSDIYGNARCGESPGSDIHTSDIWDSDGERFQELSSGM